MEKMVRYIVPQLRRTYDAVVRTLMPWRMIDVLSRLDDVERQGEDKVPEQPTEAREGPDRGPPTGKV